MQKSKASDLGNFDAARDRAVQARRNLRLRAFGQSPDRLIMADAPHACPIDGAWLIGDSGQIRYNRSATRSTRTSQRGVHQPQLAGRSAHCRIRTDEHTPPGLTSCDIPRTASFARTRRRHAPEFAGAGDQAGRGRRSQDSQVESHPRPLRRSQVERVRPPPPPHGNGRTTDASRSGAERRAPPRGKEGR